MLYLNNAAVSSAVTCDQMMDAVERAMVIYEEKKYTMPERMNVSCGDGNILLLMPCISGDYMVSKILTLYPGNRKIAKPVIQATVTLMDSRTGTVLAIMDGGTITALRTGAVGGTSIRHLARTDASSVGLAGCGVQGYHQLKYACAARGIRKITLFDRNSANVSLLTEKLKADKLNVEISRVVSAEELITVSDIIITATTSREPVLPDKADLYKGKHFIAVGSFEPSVREYPDAIFKQINRVWVDIDYAREESGEILIPLKKGIISGKEIFSLGQLIRSGGEADSGETGTTFFKTVGMALFDLVAAQLVYECSRDRGAGTLLE
ncbi:MAG: ornithine cyclodeaminase family protein [Deltaproteobacteria bacterium]|nr:ornithine cyclodeaminase family protein [Deltaproteobacteria bacterium]